MGENNCIKTRMFEGHKDFRATIQSVPPLRRENLNPETDKTLHEWLEHSDYVKPYYDVDCNFATKKEWKVSQQTIGDNWIAVLTEKFPDADIAVSTCHRKKKQSELSKKKKDVPWFVSFHFVINNYSIRMGDMETMNACLGFWDPNLIGAKKILVEGYDNSVYSDGQNFRMIYQTKPGSDAPQMPLTMADEPHRHTIQYQLGFDLESTIQIGSSQFPLDRPNKTKPIKTEYNLIETEKQTTSKTKYEKRIKTENKKVIKTENKKVIKIENENVVLEDVDTVMVEYDEVKLKTILFRITSRYEYDDWLRVLFAVYNITHGDAVGLALIHEWSALDEGYDKSFIDNEYKWLSKKTNEKTNKVGYGSLVKWAEMDNPSNSFMSLYLSNCELDENGKPTEESCPNVEGLVGELNKEMIFVKETVDYIILDEKIDGTPCWFLKGVQKVQEHYNKYSFKDPFTNRKANPFRIWSENLRRREVIRIGFNPENIDDPDIFNLWKGFAISHEDCSGADIDDCAPLLNHIKTIWCKNEDELFEYVMKYFARIIQMPHKKSGVMLCLKSKQGAGKGVVFEALSKIIGPAHYAQVSNANNVFGEFNGTLEAKILIDLDEAFWGGDKKLEGMIKIKSQRKVRL